MKVTVCQLGHRAAEFLQDWELLIEHVRTEKSDFVLLPEMPFYPWFAWKRSFDPKIWNAAVTAHVEWQSRLSELGGALVTGTSPVDLGGKRLNQAFVWDPDQGYIPSHSKYYLPDEEGFWEGTWYDKGEFDFRLQKVSGVKLGFMICTELWFFQHARAYGSAGAHLIVCPRATPRETLDKWLMGGRAAAVVSGAYSLSSNRICSSDDQANLGGQGWIVDPEGLVLGTTSREKPFLTCDLDLSLAEVSKRTYPRYVSE